MSASEVFSPADDDAAFAEVYRAHHAKLLRYCQYRLRDRHEAEDVAQEAFARAWRTMPTTAFDRNFYPWLRVVASNLCTDVLRKRSRTEPVAAMEISTIDTDVDRLSEESDRILVRQALGRLNDRHRSALMMRESEGLTYDQIAERTGVTTGTVESLLWRARQALKREFIVLAGSEGRLAVLPFLAALALRSRAAGRRMWAKLAGFAGGSEAPAAHAAMAAVAALTVATGLAATFGVGFGHGSSHAVLTRSQTGSAPSISSPARSSAGTSTTPSGAAGGAATRSGAGTLIPSASGTWAASSARSVPTPLRVQNPVPVVGAQADSNAQKAPVRTSVPGVVSIGAWPKTVTDYAQRTLYRAGTALNTVSGASSSTAP